MDLVETYQCDCNPTFTYKTKTSYKNHFKSKRHLQFENKNNIKFERAKAKENENTIHVLTHRIEVLESQVATLIGVIDTLQTQPKKGFSLFRSKKEK